MKRFILAVVLALLGGSAMAQSYYYDPATNTYYQYVPAVQAGNVVVSPGVTTASYYMPATTYYTPANTYYSPATTYYPRSSYYPSNSYSRGYYTDRYYGPYNYNRWVDDGGSYRDGWRR